TDLYVNRLGVRDDEESLNAPEIVVIGDSIAMGWGVQQDETFAQLIERRTGRKVLNAAVSSYGTVREMKMLNRIDLSHATHLIIQYTENDWPENRSFRSDGYLGAGPESALRADMESDRRRTRYWFGRYTAYLIGRLFVSKANADDDRPPPLSEQAELFVH